MKYTPSFNSLLKEGFLYSLKSPAFAKHQWSTPSSGPLAQGERTKRGRNQGIKGSQWSTLKSGPLARGESSERGRKPGNQG